MSTNAMSDPQFPNPYRLVAETPKSRHPLPQPGSAIQNLASSRAIQLKIEARPQAAMCCSECGCYDAFCDRCCPCVSYDAREAILCCAACLAVATRLGAAPARPARPAPGATAPLQAGACRPVRSPPTPALGWQQGSKPARRPTFGPICVLER